MLVIDIRWLVLVWVIYMMLVLGVVCSVVRMLLGCSGSTWCSFLVCLVVLSRFFVCSCVMVCVC